jgi:large subunit ribosomal protein L21e
MLHHAGFRRKTRSKLTKDYKKKGKISLRTYFQEFKEGDRVVLSAEPAYQKAMYYPRFHGRSGIVIGSRGSSYVVLIKYGRKEKMIIVHPVHLKKAL